MLQLGFVGIYRFGRGLGLGFGLGLGLRLRLRRQRCRRWLRLARVGVLVDVPRVHATKRLARVAGHWTGRCKRAGKLPGATDVHGCGDVKEAVKVERRQRR
jgi:hypothetical protein